MKRILLLLMLTSSAAYGQEQQQSEPQPVPQREPTFSEALQPSGSLVRQLASSGSQETTPKPDPTRVTTEAIAALRQQLLELFGAKFDDIIKQADRQQFELEKRDGDIKDAIAHLEKLMNEKFKGVDQQFAGRDTALAAALLAQKTSVDEQNKSNAASTTKSEVGFEKRIESIAQLISAQLAASDGKFSDLKDRITSIESRSEGSGSAINWVIAAVGFVSVLIGIGATVISMFNKPQPMPLPVVNYQEQPLRRRR